MSFTVVSCNVNGVRAAARRGGIDWLAGHSPDVITMQEVRGSAAHMDESLADSPFVSWHRSHAEAAAAGRNGVAVLSPIEPIDVRVGLGEFTTDGRWIEVDLPSDEHGVLTVVSAYVPTGSAGTERQAEKYRFLDAMAQRLQGFAQRSSAGSGEALITGDLNVAHRELDLKNWKGNRKKAGFLPDERAYFDRWLGYGFDGENPSTAAKHDGDWVDLCRKHGGDDAGPYSWWSWRGKAFDNDAGWRIDYLLATRGLAARSQSAIVGRAPAYDQRWSDHAPISATFA